MLADSQVATRLPAKNLERAKRSYSEKLGLQPVEERPRGFCYRCGTGYFVLFESVGAASGNHTQMAWEVADNLRHSERRGYWLTPSIEVWSAPTCAGDLTTPPQPPPRQPPTR